MTVSCGDHGRTSGSGWRTSSGSPPANGASTDGGVAPKWPTTEWAGRPMPPRRTPERHAGAPRDLDVDDAQQDRQPAPPGQHAVKHRVVRVVVVLAVAREPVPAA